MKKLTTTILLTVMLIASLFISCENNAATKDIEETVSVNFEGSRSRNLTATLEKFKKDELYWKYTAVKNSSDKSGLNAGETTAQTTVKSTGAGLGTVSGFSQGIWDFELFGYGDENFTELEYQGSATAVSLKKDSTNTVMVTVSPVQTAGTKGTLKIDADNISLTKTGTGNANGVVKVYKVVKVGGTDTNTFGTETSYTLDPGAYKVTVAFVDSTDNPTFTYASGSVVATVYSNLTTTVSGSLNELLTVATFDSEINPDIINKVASSEEQAYSSLSSDAVSLSDNATDSKVTAKVTGDSAKKIIEDVITDETKRTGSTVTLAISVDTTAATSNSLTLEIGMSATVTDSDGKATTMAIGKIKDYSTVNVNLQKGLTSVVVTHSGSEMDKMASAGADPAEEKAGGYYYDSSSGVLTVKTKTFSPFAVTYVAPVYEASIGSVNYAYLQNALDSVKDNETIKLRNNVTSNEGYLFRNNVTATLDLGGYTLKVTNGTDADVHRALYISNGNLTVKNGTIDARNVDSNGNPTDVESGTGGSYIYGTVRVEGENGAKVTLDGLTLYNNHYYGMSVKACTGNTIDIRNCEFYSSVGGCIEAEGGTITIESSTFKQSGTSKYGWVSTGIAVSYGGLITVNNFDFEAQAGNALYVYTSGGEIIVNGGTFTGEEDVAVVSFQDSAYGLSGTEPYKVTQSYLDDHGGNAARIVINGGTFTGSLKEDVDTNYTDFVIRGGTFSVDPSGYLANTKGGTAAYKAVKNEDETWSVVSEAKIGEKLYANLQDAVEAATETDTVILLRDVTIADNLDICNKNKVVLDFNGHTVTGNICIGYSPMCTGKKAQFRDSVGTGGVNGTVYVYGSELTVEGGKYLSDEKETFFVADSDVTIEGGTFTNTANTCSIFCIQSQEDDEGKTIKVKGGNFYKASSNGYIFCGSTGKEKTVVNITGGTFDIDEDSANFSKDIKVERTTT